jgi:hypothetical protein
MLLIASSSALHAKPLCTNGSDQIFILDDWSIEKVDELYSNIKFTISNNLKEPTRLTDGSIMFFDVLGSNLTNFDFPRNKLISPGETINEKYNFHTRSLRRISSVDLDLISTAICIKATVSPEGKVSTY